MKTMPLALVAACLTLSLTLGACEKAPLTTPSETEASPSETATSSALDQSSTASLESSNTSVNPPDKQSSNTVYLTYHCDNGKSVAATYTESSENSEGSADGETPAATLVIDDKHYAMYSVVSASGARYASEQGLLPNEGIQWFVKDDEAMLVAMVLDHTANPDDAQVLFRCQLAQNL
jgi:membrane-bound inhibitor of C-type lysozyme